MTIKMKEVAFVKTTGEAVFVLGTYLSGALQVRRPVAGQDGVRYEMSEFFPEELETIDQQRDRMVAEQMKIAEKYGPKAQTNAPNSDFGFGQN